MRLFINSLSASAGGGLTYVRNVFPHLAEMENLEVIAAIPPSLAPELSQFRGIKLLPVEMSASRRFWFEQTHLPRWLRGYRADALLSTGNFALRNSPVPQILLSRNSIYTSADYYRDLLARGEYGMWLDTHVRALLARQSTRWADATVAPSEAFASELSAWGASNVRAIHHGFDAANFTRDSSPLPEEIEQKLHAAEGCLKLLFVSHYNYYRNFETLFRSLPLLRDRVPRRVKLLLTCKLAPGENPGSYRPDAAARLLDTLGLSETVIQLGAVPYARLHQLYRRADVYVTPAYTETFAHPLVEAMASGLPVVASDLPVHREICGDAAVYFPRFSPEELAQRIEKLVSSPGTLKRLASAGSLRVSDFSWQKHTEVLLALARSLQQAKNGGAVD
jgi:glycosyltransferase involved in cell wall biosynthesis